MLAVTLAWTGLWAYRTQAESEVLGTLARGAAGLSVNGAPLAIVNDASPPLDARTFVELRIEAIRGALREGASDEVVTRGVDAMVDYDALTRRSLGNEADRLSDDQQRAIALRMRQIVGSNIRRTLTRTLDCTLTYASIDSATVRTEATRCLRKSDELRVDYAVQSTVSSLAVEEIVTEGSSMTTAYYGQFQRMLLAPDQGYAYLIEKLDAKVARSSLQR